jgi:hypothetical protein
MQQKQEVKKSKTTFCKIFVHACLGFVPKKIKKQKNYSSVFFFFAKAGTKKESFFRMFLFFISHPFSKSSNRNIILFIPIEIHNPLSPISISLSFILLPFFCKKKYFSHLFFSMKKIWQCLSF